MTVTLRPEVQSFAESMQRLLDQHQGEKGDAWKTDDAGELMGSVERAAMRLRGAIFEYPTKTARLPRIGEAAASVGLHAMFVSDVMGALPPPQPAFTDEEQRRVIAMLTKPVGTKRATPEARINQTVDMMMDRLQREFGALRIAYEMPAGAGTACTVSATMPGWGNLGTRILHETGPSLSACLATLLRHCEDEERREQERLERGNEQAGRFLERLIKEHGVKKIAFVSDAEMRAVCAKGEGIYYRTYDGSGATLADALADLLGHLERAKQGGAN